MMTRRFLLTASAAGLGVAAIPALWDTAAAPQASTFEIMHSEAEWRALLTPAQFGVLRQHVTERPGSSPLLAEHRTGTFNCAGCDLTLFSSATKYESHTGWPSFWKPEDNAIGTHEDRAYGMVRTEVHCRRCGGHQGHVFNDGPVPTGQRYCINGAALTFKPQSA